MASMRSMALAILALFVSGIHSQKVTATAQNSWVAPGLPDESTTITKGQTYNIQWNNNLTLWFAGYAPDADINNVTLWVSGAVQTQFSHVIAQNIDVNKTTSHSWKIDLPDDELGATDDWGFHFVASGNTTFDAGGWKVDSPQVRIVSNTPTTTTARTTPPIRTGPPTSSTSAAAAPLTPTPIPQPSGGLSGGAVAGVAIGAAIIALGAAAGAFFLWRRKRKQRKAAEAAAAAPGYDASQAAHAHQSGVGFDGGLEPKQPYEYNNFSHSGVATPAGGYAGTPSIPGTPGTGGHGYMSEMHAPSDGGHTFYAPAMPYGQDKKHDPVPPYAPSELPGSRPQSPSELHGEGSQRMSSQTARSGEAGRYSQGGITRRISGGTTHTLGSVGSPLGSPRLQSPLGNRIDEDEGGVGHARNESGHGEGLTSAQNVGLGLNQGQSESREAVSPPSLNASGESIPGLPPSLHGGEAAGPSEEVPPLPKEGEHSKTDESK